MSQCLMTPEHLNSSNSQWEMRAVEPSANVEGYLLIRMNAPECFCQLITAR